MTKIIKKDSGEVRMSVGVGKPENPFRKEAKITHFIIFLKNIIQIS